MTDNASFSEPSEYHLRSDRDSDYLGLGWTVCGVLRMNREFQSSCDRPHPCRCCTAVLIELQHKENSDG